MKAADFKSAEQGMRVRIQRTNAQFRKAHIKGAGEVGSGQFLLLLDITAINHDVFIPVSIASGKKPTGFIYQIEGTKPGEIVEATVKPEGRETMQITLGTITYCKIPATKTGTFRIIVTMQGKMGSEYTVVVNRINYKFDPSDARYVRLIEDFRSESVAFK